MSYGKNGTKYTLNGQEIFVNEKFLTATMFATILVLAEVVGEEGIHNAVETVATAIYEQIKESESEGTEGPADGSGKPA